MLSVEASVKFNIFYDLDLEIIFYLFCNTQVSYVQQWDSLVAQLVKNLPAMQEIPVQFLGCEDPLENG